MRHQGPWFNIKIPSYQYRKSHCGDKLVVRPSYLHNGISYTGKMASLYWITTTPNPQPHLTPPLTLPPTPPPPHPRPPTTPPHHHPTTTTTTTTPRSHWVKPSADAMRTRMLSSKFLTAVCWLGGSIQNGWWHLATVQVLRWSLSSVYVFAARRFCYINVVWSSWSRSRYHFCWSLRSP